MRRLVVLIILDELYGDGGVDEFYLYGDIGCKMQVADGDVFCGAGVGVYMSCVIVELILHLLTY